MIPSILAVTTPVWTVYVMKIWQKLLLSALAGVFAMLLYSTPMWWGVLFSPISQPLTTADEAEVLREEGGLISWEVDGVTFRFRSLDLLLDFLSRF